MVNQRILDALRMGDLHLAELTVVHITDLLLKASLAVLGVRITALTSARKVLVSSAVAEWS
jgi:hypothetical protein